MYMSDETAAHQTETATDQHKHMEKVVVPMLVDLCMVQLMLRATW
jgi:hypothetical protein